MGLIEVASFLLAPHRGPQHALGTLARRLGPKIRARAALRLGVCVRTISHAPSAMVLPSFWGQNATIAPFRVHFAEMFQLYKNASILLVMVHTQEWWGLPQTFCEPHGGISATCGMLISGSIFVSFVTNTMADVARERSQHGRTGGQHADGWCVKLAHSSGFSPGQYTGGAYII